MIQKGVFGCLCVRATCVNPLKLLDQQDKCSPCTLLSGCTFPDLCIPGLKICASCYTTIRTEASAGCFKGATGNTGGNSNSSNNEAQTTIPGTNIAIPCVSTQWLAERGIQRATVLRDFAPSRAHVLCIPDADIPCGTPGHLLRAVATGELMSYRTICEDHRKDCVRSAMPVSQLSHNYDWSVYTDRVGTYELTSLSAHPDAESKYSPSRLLATVVDTLNKAGLGRVCDAFLLLTHRTPSTKLPSIASTYTLNG